MLQITPRTAIPLSEIDLSAVRSQGAGGQNVNKVSTAIHLRFDINASSLSPLYKERLLNLNDSRITKDGLNHRFGHSGRTACLISKVSSMRDRALRHLVQMNYSVNG